MWKEVLKTMLEALRIATWQATPPRPGQRPGSDRKRQR